MYRVEAAVRIGLTNPTCTSIANEWLPNRKTIELKEIKDLDFNREDFGQKGEKERSLIASPKKVFDNWKNVIENHWVWRTLPKLSLKFLLKVYSGTEAKGGFCQRTYSNKNCST